METITAYISRVLNRKKYVIVFLLLLAYAVATCYRASQKLFWFDELFTIYLARLPDLVSLWSASRQGTDFNPPLFYQLIRLAQLPAGEGHVVTRLPAILGFGLFCLCLFRYVSVQSSALGGFVGMVFPLVTTAYWYAYEARAHGIVLGFCGVALICWQAATFYEERRVRWLLGMGGALACAMLTHAYAVLLLLPLMAGELGRTVTLRRVDWPIWATFIAAAVAMWPSFLLLGVATAHLGTTFAPPSLVALADAYKHLLGPGTSVLGGALILLGFAQIGRPFRALGAVAAHTARSYEIIALCAFVTVPFFTFLASRLTGAPFFHRYSISAIAGFAGLLGITVATRPVIALGVLLMLLAQAGIDLLQYTRTSSIQEPSSAITISTDTRQFVQQYTSMAAGRPQDVPIVLLDNLAFLPLLHYAPTNLASRLVYVLWTEDEVIGRTYLLLQHCCHAPGKVVHFSEFLAAHNRFLVYGGPRSAPQVSDFIRAGATVTVEDISHNYFLVLVNFK